MPYKSPQDRAARDAWRRNRVREMHAAPTPDVVRKLLLPVPKHGLKIAVIPDTQARQGVPLEHLEWCGKYLCEIRPDVIVHIGDIGDFPSLSTHDQKGSLHLEGARYRDDVDAVLTAQDLLMTPVAQASGYAPMWVLNEGNHEDRITRAINADPKMEGFMSLKDLEFEKRGWLVYPFLQPVSIGGVAFCHYFPSGIMGRPITSARALLTKLHMSAFAGHQQGRDIAYGKRADGQDMTAIISGSFYQHNEHYLSPFTNLHWRGMYVLHEVKDGSFDEMAISINYLKRKFGK